MTAIALFAVGALAIVAIASMGAVAVSQPPRHNTPKSSPDISGALKDIKRFGDQVMDTLTRPIQECSEKLKLYGALAVIGAISIMNSKAKNREDSDAPDEETAIAEAKEKAGDTGQADWEEIIDPETGKVIGRRSPDNKQEWRIDPPHKNLPKEERASQQRHVNWKNWKGGKKDGGYGHVFYQQEIMTRGLLFQGLYESELLELVRELSVEESHKVREFMAMKFANKATKTLTAWENFHSPENSWTNIHESLPYAIQSFSPINTRVYLLEEEQNDRIVYETDIESLISILAEAWYPSDDLYVLSVRFERCLVFTQFDSILLFSGMPNFNET